MIKDGFVLRKMPGLNLVMPAGENVKEFQGALMLNDTGALIFEALQNGGTSEDAAALLTREYDVTMEKALASVQNTVDSLREAGVIQ